MEANISDTQAAQATASSVWVSFAIAANGTFETTLRASSGNAEVDEAILDAARRWRWKPALREGQPIASKQSIHFKIAK